MNYLDFKSQLFDFGCFTTNQVNLFYPNFDRNNLTRWCKKGYIVNLRQGWYVFFEYKTIPNFNFYLANKIYKPSYISLHAALAFYGLIPEAVSQITSISTLKTANFKNGFGDFSYKNINEKLFFGYELKPMKDKRNILFATIEKAILDFFYLYYFYNTEEEMINLRFDEDILQGNFNKEKLLEYLQQFENKALEKRVKLFINTYQL